MYRFEKIIFLLLCITLATSPVLAADYLGRDIDGETFSATAFSYSTGKYYYVDVEFNCSEVTLYFRNGRSITLSLDDDEIDDPSSISAFDYRSGTHWDLDVDIY